LILIPCVTTDYIPRLLKLPFSVWEARGVVLPNSVSLLPATFSSTDGDFCDDVYLIFKIVLVVTNLEYFYFLFGQMNSVTYKVTPAPTVA
jgi:hypothetical protein